MTFIKRIPALLIAAVVFSAPVLTAVVALQPVSAESEDLAFEDAYVISFVPGEVMAGSGKSFQYNGLSSP